MSGLAAAFRPGRKALIAYITAGYPSLAATEEIVPALAASGCDIIELGIPFSDPLADGATIQKASYLALQRGATPELCLELAGRLSGKVGAPLVFMTYYNPVLNFGPERFCRSCREAGVRGLIVPDLPPDEGGELESLTRRHGLDLVYLLAPNSSEERIKLVAARSRGFIYLVSLTGVTGARESLPRELEDFVLRVRRHAGQPLCVGFGISSTAQAARIAQTADGVIVGSRFIQLIEEDPSLTALGKFVAALRRAVDGRKDEPGANPP